MIGKLLLLCVAGLIALFLLYAIIPTVLIRVIEWRVTKRIKGEGVALTFDDGPSSEYTEDLLDLLKKYDVKASFFVVGSHALRNPDIIQRMHREGHTIGIHHNEHISSWLLTPFKLKKQLQEAKATIEGLINEKVTYYRPPWGHFNIFSPFLAKQYKVMMWSEIFGDWKVENCKNSLLDQLRQTKDGAILLLHDCGETWGADREAPKFMMENLEIFLKESKAKGRSFFTLKDIFN